MYRVHELDAQRIYADHPTETGWHKIAHNTWADRNGASVWVKYHSTIIAAIHEDGSVTVNTGGYQTSTTKTRLNALLPGRTVIFQKDWRWYFYGGDRGEARYQDYATVHPDGSIDAMNGDRIL